MATLALLSYNRRLGLLAAAAAFWALIGIAASLGMVRGEDQPPPLSVSLGVPPGGVVLPGELVAIEQSDGVLSLTIGRPPNAPEGLPAAAELPDDIAVDFVTVEPRGPGQMRRQPPRISLGPGEQRPRRLPGGDHLLLADKYAVRFGRGEVRVFPRPAERGGEFLRRMFGRERGPGPREERPGAGPREG
ncbi:MAG TPA: hypothetical protein ENO21_01335, partial [Firmicutes bacterium]|nr:hypothetical protein [Bacillota bacterium]